MSYGRLWASIAAMVAFGAACGSQPSAAPALASSSALRSPRGPRPRGVPAAMALERVPRGRPHDAHRLPREHRRRRHAADADDRPERRPHPLERVGRLQPDDLSARRVRVRRRSHASPHVARPWAVARSRLADRARRRRHRAAHRPLLGGRDLARRRARPHGALHPARRPPRRGASLRRGHPRPPEHRRKRRSP